MWANDEEGDCQRFSNQHLTGSRDRLPFFDGVAFFHTIILVLVYVHIPKGLFFTMSNKFELFLVLALLYYLAQTKKHAVTYLNFSSSIGSGRTISRASLKERLHQALREPEILMEWQTANLVLHGRFIT
jgi:hypothetical protein